MNTLKEKNYISIINDNRNSIMGFAILWIVFFHSDVVFSIPLIKLFKSIGYGGVDIFFFLSGIGIYFSLMKDPRPVSFYKKRCLRILPLFVPIIILFYILIAFTMNWSFSSAIEFTQGLIGNMLFFGSFIGLKYQFLWFISALMCFYLISPPLYHLSKSINENRINLSFVLLIIVLFQIPFLFNDYDLLMLISRFPIYFLGMLVASISQNPKKHINQWLTIVLMLIGWIILGLMLISPDEYHSLFFEQLGMFWYPFILITPGLCWLLGIFFSLAKKQRATNYICCLFEFCGKNSLGICLVHILINYFIIYSNISLSFWEALVVMIVSVLLGILYDRTVNYIVKKVKKNMSSSTS